MYKADYDYLITYSTPIGVVHNVIGDEDTRQWFLYDYNKYKELRYKWMFIERYFPQPKNPLLKEFINYAREVYGINITFRKCKEGEKPDTIEDLLDIKRDSDGNPYFTPIEKRVKLSIRDAISNLAWIANEISFEDYESQEALKMAIMALSKEADLKGEPENKL